MKKKFFVKNFFMFVFPILIPIIILGSLSIVITQNYIVDEIHKSNQVSLRQTRETFELIYKQMNTLDLTFTGDTTLRGEVREALAQEDLVSLFPSDVYHIQTLLDSMVNSNANIHSIYLYMENDHGNFLSAPVGHARLSNASDTEWFDMMEQASLYAKNWTARREAKRYRAFGDKVTLISLFRRFDNNRGIIVLNLRENHLRSLLDNSISYPEQSLLVFDGDSNLILSNTGSLYENITYDQLNSGLYHTDNIIISSVSVFNNWKYVSIIPKSTVEKTPRTLLRITVTLIILSGMVGTALTYFLTRRNYKLLLDIVSIVEKAELGDPLPDIHYDSSDQYNQIVNNILKMFIEKSNLKLELSEKKYQMESLEFRALQSQINPHFLNNTLHAIYWEAFKLTKSPNSATMMLEDLAEILEYAFGDPRESVTVQEEVTYTKNYLKILNYRYQGKFQTLWQVRPDTLALPIKKLILQPLVENSIYHGIKEQSGQGCIKIKSYIRSGNLWLTVIDNGVGMDKETLKKTREDLLFQGERGQHIGLNNTYRRLLLLYGEDCSFIIRSKQGLGTVVTVKIPLDRL